MSQGTSHIIFWGEEGGIDEASQSGPDSEGHSLAAAAQELEGRPVQPLAALEAESMVGEQRLDSPLLRCVPRLGARRAGGVHLSIEQLLIHLRRLGINIFPALFPLF